MIEPMPVVLVPGLLCTPALYAPQMVALWQFGAVTVPDHRRDATMAAIAQRILGQAPPRFALAGLSMGGYIALEIMRQAPARVDRLALLSTAARADTPEQSERRKHLVEIAQAGRLAEVGDTFWPLMLPPARQGDAALRRIFDAMIADTGVDAFVRQQSALMSRSESRPLLPSIRCLTLVLTGDSDELIPPDRSEEMAAAIPGARLVTLPGCGHLPTLERPELATAALVEWMQR